MKEDRQRRRAERRARAAKRAKTAGGKTAHAGTADIVALLPGFNCRDCGYSGCAELALALAEKKAAVDKCRFLAQVRYQENLAKLTAMLGGEILIKEEKPVGVIDGYVADFLLKPLPGECSCREILYPFYHKEYNKDDLIRYRPLGCPLPHFARILEADKGLITVHLIGPCHRIEGNDDMTFEDIGVCMVGGFIGIVEGKKPKVGATVRFVPDGCMMQKVHSGVVVQMENGTAIIEGIDLKVWGLPETAI